MNNFPHPPVIVIGAPAGGVNAVLELAPALPRNFPAPILFVQHIGAHRSELWKLASARGPNTAVNASDGAVPRPGTIHIAPPDQHMLLDGPVIRLSRGPKEHHARPAIDPLFRSAALQYGPRAIGVILTGMLADGSAGLRAIKECGGTAVGQDPADAHAPSMPRSGPGLRRCGPCRAAVGAGAAAARSGQPSGRNCHAAAAYRPSAGARRQQ